MGAFAENQTAEVILPTKVVTLEFDATTQERIPITLFISPPKMSVSLQLLMSWLVELMRITHNTCISVARKTV